MTKDAFRSVSGKPQRMALADDLFPALEAGFKLCTIRAGKRDIATGELTFFTTSRNGHEVKVNVTEVRYKKLGELTDAEAQLDGADNAAHMARALKRFYPDIDAQSMITIVLYEPPQKAAPKVKAPAPKK